MPVYAIAIALFAWAVYLPVFGNSLNVFWMVVLAVAAFIQAKALRKRYRNGK